MPGKKIFSEKIKDNEVESRLAEAFRPVKPSHRFVKNVRERIRFASPMLIASKPPETQHLLLVLGGVLTVALFIVTIGRAIYFFFRQRENS